MAQALGLLDRSGSGLPSSAPSGLVNHSTVTPAPSPGDFPHADLHGLRRRFPERWMAFLHAHFSGPQHVAVFFDVDRRTATDWWHGRHGVNAAPVVMAMRLIPGAVAELLEAA